MSKTYSVIPHAASGSAAHTGRGGFPGPHRLIAALVRTISPKTANQVYTFVAEDPKARSLRWAHPFQSFEQTAEPSLEKRKDVQEARHAERVKWLPPSVRGVVVGRNSQIYDEELDVEDLELFAEIEYRALSLLTALIFVVSPEAVRDHATSYTDDDLASVPLYHYPVEYHGDLFRQGAQLERRIPRKWPRTIRDSIKSMVQPVPVDR